MTTSTIDRRPRRPRFDWQLDLPMVFALAAALGAAAAICEDATLRLVLWAFLN